MPRIRLPLALCALVLTGVLTLSGASAGAASKKLCSSSSANSLRGGYYLGLTVSGGATCSSARSLQAAWQSCRLKSSRAAKCQGAGQAPNLPAKKYKVAKLHGYKCTEVRQAIPTQVTGAVSCTSGKKKVSWTYQQNVV